MADGCFYTEDADSIQKIFTQNFLEHYTKSKAPFPLFFHAAWFFNRSHRKEGFLKFIDSILALPDVYFVTSQELIAWTRFPEPLPHVLILRTPTPGTYSQNPYPRYLFPEPLLQVLIHRTLTPGTYSQNPYPRYLFPELLPQVLIPRTPTPCAYPKNPYPRYLFHIENPYPRYLYQESLPQVLIPRILIPSTYPKNPYPKYLSHIEPLS